MFCFNCPSDFLRSDRCSCSDKIDGDVDVDDDVVAAVCSSSFDNGFGALVDGCFVHAAFEHDRGQFAFSDCFLPSDFRFLVSQRLHCLWFVWV